jgi:DNA-nicking Smr family endonuclease
MKLHDIHELGPDPDSATDEPIPFPITGELDLHTFRPSEIGDLLPDYFAECIKRGILTVRVIHGKGTGTLREGVHRLLETLPVVESWQWPASPTTGHWGATWVYLRPDAA